MSRTLIGFVFLFVALFPSLGSADSVTYDFSTCTRGTNCWAYGISATALPPGANNLPNTIFTAGEYDNVDADDTVYEEASINNNNYGAHRFSIDISQTESKVYQITPSWNGWGINTRGGRQDGANLYIWNFNSGSYTYLAQNANENQTTLTSDITTNTDNYIDTDNIILLVEQRARTGQAGTYSRVRTDYISLTIYYDNTAPTTTINDPAAGTWENAAFTVDVTNADTGGSGLSTCYYRVLSNSVQTLGWTSYTCGNDPSITVGAAANCRNQGSNMCQVEFYNTDGVGNVGTTQTRQYSIDWTAPTFTVTDGANASWNNSDTITVTVSDTGGSGADATTYWGYSADGTCNAADDANLTNTSLTTTVTTTHTDYICFLNTDGAGNKGYSAAIGALKVDGDSPTTTINNPADGTWESAAFTVDVTNADTGGSGLSTCYYRVLSNSVQTLGWTSYTCGNDPSITVGAAANCRDQGSNICQVEFYNTDAASNTGTTQSRQFSIDWSAPTTTINYPAAASWQTADFTADVTNADTGGSGLSTCYYRVLSNSVQTLGWTSYTCGNDPSITVGASADCRDQGSNICQVEFYNTDAAGNTGTTQSRQFGIDWSSPTVTINNPAASSCQPADFTFDVTNADTGGSGLSTCYYRVLSNSVQTLGWTSYTCGNDPSITVGASADCRDQGADLCSVEAYDTDAAGNTGTTQTRNFTADWASPVQSGWAPADGSNVSTSVSITFTLNELGDCRWSMDGDESYTQMSDDGDCTGDGTINMTCDVPSLAEGVNSIWIACKDECGNENSAADNKVLTYTVDSAPPAQTTWDPAKGAVICDTSQTIAVTTDENAWCRWNISDLDYNSMTSDCTGGGTTSLSCSASGFAHGAQNVYVACKDVLNNKDSNTTNEDINYTVDIIAPSGYSCSTPADVSVDVSLTPTLTSAIATDVSNISYYFQIDDNSGFTNANGRRQESGWLSLDNDWAPAALDSNRTYYWRV